MFQLLLSHEVSVYVSEFEEAGEKGVLAYLGEGTFQEPVKKKGTCQLIPDWNSNL
jgi:hypothetical protein